MRTGPLPVVVLALVAASCSCAQDAWEKARDAARADLVRFRDEADREVLERQQRIAGLRRELLDVSGRASEAELESVGLGAKLDAATRARDEGQRELEEVEAGLEDVSKALDEREAGGKPAAESRPAAARFEAAVDASAKRLGDAASIRMDGRLVRIGDLQWLEPLAGDQAIVGRAGGARPVGPVPVPGLGQLIAALEAGAPPPFVFVDPTGRLDVTPPAVSRDLAGWFRAGGPIVIVIVVLGGLGLLLGLGRLALLLVERSPDPATVSRAAVEARSGEWEAAARTLAARKGSVHAALAEVALAGSIADASAREAKVEQILLRTVDRFERFLHLVAVLAAVSPLLGLLGTVVGMIRMFDALAGGSTGASHVEALSGGIGEALITTEAGILFAIPLILLHALLTARADRLEGALEEATLEISGGKEVA